MKKRKIKERNVSLKRISCEDRDRESLNYLTVSTALNSSGLCLLSSSFPTPNLEGRSNLTSLDIQIKKLRDSALSGVKDGAKRMRDEAREIRDTLSELESWADKLKLLAEEVETFCRNL